MVKPVKDLYQITLHTLILSSKAKEKVDTWIDTPEMSLRGILMSEMHTMYVTATSLVQVCGG